MSDGLEKILNRIKENPNRDILKERYIALVSELHSHTEKYQRILTLAEVYMDVDSAEALTIANIAYQIDRSQRDALILIIKILEHQKNFDKAEVVKEQLAQLQIIPQIKSPPIITEPENNVEQIGERTTVRIVKNEIFGETLELFNISEQASNKEVAETIEKQPAPINFSPEVSFDSSSESLVDPSLSIQEKKKNMNSERELFEHLTKQFESFSSKIKFKDGLYPLRLDYPNGWTKAEIAIVTQALKYCEPNLVWKFINSNWGHHPDASGLEILSSLDLAESSPEYWGIYLDCMIAGGYSRKALVNIRNMLEGKSDLQWAKTCWKRVNTIYKNLQFANLHWSSAEGIEILRHNLKQRPQLSYTALFIPKQRLG